MTEEENLHQTLDEIKELYKSPDDELYLTKEKKYNKIPNKIKKLSIEIDDENYYINIPLTIKELSVSIASDKMPVRFLEMLPESIETLNIYGYFFNKIDVGNLIQLFPKSVKDVYLSNLSNVDYFPPNIKKIWINNNEIKEFNLTFNKNMELLTLGFNDNDTFKYKLNLDECLEKLDNCKIDEEVGMRTSKSKGLSYYKVDEDGKNKIFDKLKLRNLEEYELYLLRQYNLIHWFCNTDPPKCYLIFKKK